MFGVEALPLVHAFARSHRPEERAIFARVYRDLLAAGEAPTPDWRAAFEACLAKASPAERGQYLAAIAPPRARRPQAGRFAFSSRDEIDEILRKGRPEDWVALASDRKARLRPEQVEALAPRARALAEAGDRRLAEALLGRDAARLALAPLFLEASPAQRAEMMLAAQRETLGRRARAPTLDAETAGRLEFAAIAGEAREFAEALGAALGADADLAARIAADSGGEPLAVALIALGAPRDLAVRVVTGRDMQEGAGFPRIHALARLSDRLSPAAARLILDALVGRTRAAPEPMPASGARAAANPSPFLRREGAALASPGTSARPARYSQSP